MPIITKIANAQALSELLQVNPGVILIKLGATWCGPCKKIEPLVMQWLQRMPQELVQIALIDIDENIDLYGFYKKKRVVNGVPTILAYYPENEHYTPDDMTTGSDPNNTNNFFLRIAEYIQTNYTKD
jgi:thiol-disulfide isomerase/thioredoxin